MSAYGKIAMFGLAMARRRRACEELGLDWADLPNKWTRGQREPEQARPTLMIPQRDPPSVTGNVARRHRKGARSALLLGDFFVRPKQQHENAI
jgi:hypothetical protein